MFESTPPTKKEEPAKTGFEPLKVDDTNSTIMDEQRETISDLEW